MSSILQSRRILHVGGLAEQVVDTTLRAAFIPFGPIKSIDIVSVTKALSLHNVFRSSHVVLSYTNILQPR